MKVTTSLRQLINSGDIAVAPGIADGLSARLVEAAQFSCVYASGGAIARSTGCPDIGLLSLTEVCARLREITAVTSLPVIADADTGFGNAINVARTVRLFEQAGVAALHLEDQEFPKRCGHLDGKHLISKEAMQQKIRVAKKSLQDPDFVLIARTDAIAVDGFDAAIERANAYREAGADVIFVEAPQSREQIEAIAQAVPGPKLINMFYGGKTPLIPLPDLSAMGFSLVIIPSDLQRSAIAAMQRTLAAIKEDGDSHRLADQLASFKEREEIVQTKDYLALDKDR